MTTPLTRSELAALAGADEAQIERLEGLGLVAAGDGGVRRGDVMRVRLVLALEAAGIGTDLLAGAVRAGHLSLDFSGSVSHDPVMLSQASVGEALALMGMPETFARRLWLAAGFPGFNAGTLLREDDLELLGLIAEARAIGVSDEALIRTVRVLGHAMRRVVNVMRDLFRAEVEDRLLAQGRSPAEMLLAGAEQRAVLQRLGHRSVFLLHRRFLEEAVFANVATRVLEILESVGHPVPAGTAAPTVAFVDLSGFTRFAEATGDAAAAERAAQLEALAQEAAVQRGGRLVKSLGDGAMLLFDEAGAGVAACLEIVAAVARLADVEARAGLATGPVVQRDGDVFGATVNLAARIADHARPGEVLASRLTREAAGARALAFAGPIEASLKGIAAPVALYRAALLDAPRPAC